MVSAPRVDGHVGLIVVRSLAGTVLLELQVTELPLPELREQLQACCGAPVVLQRLVQGGRLLVAGDKLAPKPGPGAEPLEVVLALDSRPARPSDLRPLQRLACSGLGELWACAWPAAEEALAVRKVPLKLFASCVRRADVEHAISVLRRVEHVCIARYRFDFEDDEYLYFGTELPTRGTLANLLEQAGPLSCKAAARHFYDLCDAFQFLHEGSEKLVHWNLSPEAVGFDEAGRVKLRDLGWSSAVVPPFFSLREFATSPHYLGPETILGSAHSESLDMWQLGALLFEMLVGSPAFGRGENEAVCSCRILKADLRFPAEMDPDACDLIAGLCQKDPSSRLTAAKAMMHPFVTKHLQPLQASL